MTLFGSFIYSLVSDICKMSMQSHSLIPNCEKKIDLRISCKSVLKVISFIYSMFKGLSCDQINKYNIYISIKEHSAILLFSRVYKLLQDTISPFNIIQGQTQIKRI